VAGPAADPDARDEREDDVLRADPGREPPIDADLIGLRVALEQRLGREDHLDFARADPERQRTEGAVGARVRVAAHDRHAGLGETQLRPDHVDDPLAGVTDAVERDPEFRAVRLELADLRRGELVEDRQARGRRGDRMVGRGDGLAGPADAQSARAQTREGLRAGDLVDEVEVDGEDGRRPGPG
jgi:hypothetical protein